MNLNKEYISSNNSYPNQKAAYIVIHNTDNYSAGADARAQHDGNFKGLYRNRRTYAAELPGGGCGRHLGR